MPYFQKIKKYVSNNANWYFYIYNETEKSILDKIEDLRIKDEHIYILPSEQFYTM